MHRPHQGGHALAVLGFFGVFWVFLVAMLAAAWESS
jgi:hypothetical protein